jgi:hypothetical protein
MLAKEFRVCPHAYRGAAKVPEVASCGRGSESAMWKMGGLVSREHEGDLFRLSACLRMAVQCQCRGLAGCRNDRIRNMPAAPMAMEVQVLGSGTEGGGGGGFDDWVARLPEKEDVKVPLP